MRYLIEAIRRGYRADPDWLEKHVVTGIPRHYLHLAFDLNALPAGSWEGQDTQKREARKKNYTTI
jgi:hypothetical protein